MSADRLAAILGAQSCISDGLDTEGSSDGAPVIAASLVAPVVAWLDTLVLAQRSSHTITAYRRAVMDLAAFLTQLGINQWHDCGKHILESYFVGRLEVSRIKPVSARLAHSAISSFYGYLQQSDDSIVNPTLGYQIRGGARKLPEIADVDLMMQLLDQCTPEDSAQARLWIRDKAIFELAYSSGLRVSELAALNVADVDLEASWVQVLGKGKKMRQLPIGSKARDAILAYLPHRDLWQEQDSDALFISERFGVRLTSRAIQLRLKVCAARAGIDQRLYPHLLRHCFASHMLSASGDLRAVQELLGHSNLSTTQIYTHVDFMTLAKIYDRAHPRA